jgi:6-phosphogluconolactonase
MLTNSQRARASAHRERLERGPQSHTVRTQSKAIFNKAGRRTQAALLSLAGSLCVLNSDEIPVANSERSVAGTYFKWVMAKRKVHVLVTSIRDEPRESIAAVGGSQLIRPHCRCALAFHDHNRSIDGTAVKHIDAHIWVVGLMLALSGCGGGSKTAAPVAVPNVVNTTQASASTAITGAGLVVGTVAMQSSSTAASGTVISENPAAATSVAPGSTINLVISSGPAMVSVPNNVGVTQAAATTAITGAGLTVGTVTMQSSGTVASGEVISESPAPGTSVVVGSAVNLTVSTGATVTNSFAYVANNGMDGNNLGTLSAYSINSTTGALTALSSSPIEVAGSSQLYEAKIDPSGQYLYVVDSGANAVFAFLINQNSGVLTPVTGSPFATGNGPESLAFDSAGHYVYVANSSAGTISAFSLTASTGVLVQLSNSPYTVVGTGPQPTQLATAGNHLYVVDSGTNSVEVFSIAAGTGQLTEGVPGSPFAAGTGAYSLAIDPSGAVLYAASVDGISGFKINSTTGVLSAVAGNPLTIPVANYLGIDPQGKFLFVTETNGIGVYPLNTSTGVLGAVASGSPFSTGGTNPYSVSVDPTDHFVYVGNDTSANVAEFTLNSSSGVLTPIAGSPITAGTFPDFLAIQ